MKLLLRILLLFVFGLKLKAQVVSVHCDYDFQNHIAGKTDDLFFVTHIKSGLDSDFFQIQLDMAARKILKATNSGEPISKVIPFYQPAKLYSKDIALSDFMRWKQAEFNEPASAALNSNHYSSYSKLPFVKDGAAAVCDRDLRIEPGGKYFFGFDTVFTNRKKNQFKLVPRPVNVSGVIPFFSEEWSFNMDRGTFRKNILYYGFAFGKTVWWLYWRQQFMLECEPDTGGFDSLLRKNVIYDVAVSRHDAQAAHGVVPSDSYPDSYTDVSGEMGNVDGSERSRLIGALMFYASVHPDKVHPVYHELPDTTKHFNTLYELESCVSQWDSTHQVEDPNNPGTYILAPLKRTFQVKEVYAIRFYEDWYFDKKACCVRKKVRYVSFLFDVIDTTKEPILQQAGFAIHLN